MFSQYNGNDLFDYTPIISGYVKSIEQLMYQIIVISVYDGDSSKFGDQFTTMDTLCKYFRKNPCIFRIADTTFRNTLKDCLYCYKKECRNNHFHKHNIYNWNQVKDIRSNTLILYIMLFGGCNLGKDDEEIRKNFRIVDDKLERIYFGLRGIPLRITDFYIKFKGEEMSVKCSRITESSFPQFDRNGFLVDFGISFRCEEDSAQYSKGDLITVTRDHIPEEIVYFCGDEPEWVDFSDWKLRT